MGLKMKGCDKILIGEEGMSLNCGNRTGKWIDNEWVWSSKVMLCKECEDKGEKLV